MKFDLGDVEVHKRKRLPHWNLEHGYQAEKNAIRHWEQAKLGETLDKDHGSCFMRDERIATLVADAIMHFDGERYELLAWCVMPNHVYLVLTLSEGEKMDRLIHSWKGYAGKEANKLLRRRGQFWQEDYWDHAIRDSRELRETIEYVLKNPKPGWKFVRCYLERIPF